METIYDFKPTEEEVRLIHRMNKDAYLEKVTEQSAIYHLCWLFMIRKEKELFDKYFPKLRKDLQQSFILSATDI